MRIVSDLQLDSLDVAGDTVMLCDERESASHAAAPPSAFVSVTLEGHDASWGEFLTRRDALAIRAWLDRVLDDDDQTKGAIG